MASAVGTGLQKVLREQGRKKVWLAGQMGVSRAILHNWDTGRTKWPADRKTQAARILGVSESDL